MENYEQKYKEALKVIGSLYNVVKYQSSSDALLASQTIEKAFPELNKSEDERIRKEILRHFEERRSTVPTKAVLDEWIAWLEKQGEQETDEWKEGNIIRHGDILTLVIKGRRAIKSNGELFTVQCPNEWVKAVPNEIERFLNELEKQGE